MIQTKIVGVTFRPPGSFDGLNEGEELHLVAEPENEHDNNAVAVYREHKDENEIVRVKLGYIRRGDGLNAAFAEAMKAGCEYECRISALTGHWHHEDDGASTPNHNGEWGINISIRLKGRRT